MRISKKIIMIAFFAVSAAAILSILLAVVKNRAEAHKKAQRKLEFTEDGLLAEMRSSPLWDEGQGEWVFYDTVYQVYNDGSQVFFAENFQDGYTVELPPVTSRIPREEVLAIQEVIEENEFMELPEDMSNNTVCDGGEMHLTVYTASQSHTSGGNNPFGAEGTERLSAICSAIRGPYTDAQVAYRREVDRILKEQYNARNHK